MIVATFTGAQPTAAILESIRSGQVGGIILFGDNTVGGVATTHPLVEQLQQAAEQGGNPPLLIMTDEEGTTVLLQGNYCAPRG
jgi:beta-glucosidase-like glycosyl hydrolase